MRYVAEADYERDDDFVFTRKSKRAKTEESEPKRQQSGRARPAQGRVAKDAAPDAIEEVETATPPAKKKQQQQQTRRKLGGDVFDDEQLQAKIPKRSARQGSRQPDEQRRSEEPRVATTSTNGSSRGRNGPAKAKNAATAARSRHIFDSPPPEEVVQSKITLPMSDTPIINRNKEMRKKGTGDRRSSLGSRGRRASSLIESGQTALPHREVKPAQFYKHIEAEGLTEPRRMKQLLTWCGERALSEKPRHGTVNSSVIHGGESTRWAGDDEFTEAKCRAARAIQDQLLKDFGSRSEFSDWFSRDDGPKAPLVLKPNPRNTELDEKMAQLEKNIKRYGEETIMGMHSVAQASLTEAMLGYKRRRPRGKRCRTPHLSSHYYSPTPNLKTRRLSCQILTY